MSQKPKSSRKNSETTKDPEAVLKSLWSEDAESAQKDALKEELLEGMLDIISEYLFAKRSKLDQQLENLKSYSDLASTHESAIYFRRMASIAAKPERMSFDDAEEDVVQVAPAEQPKNRIVSSISDLQQEDVAFDTLLDENARLKKMLEDVNDQYQVVLQDYTSTSETNQRLLIDMNHQLDILESLELQNARLNEVVVDLKERLQKVPQVTLDKTHPLLEQLTQGAAEELADLRAQLAAANVALTQKDGRIAQITKDLTDARAVKFQDFVVWLHKNFDSTNSSGIKTILREADKMLKNQAANTNDDVKFQAIAQQLHTVSDKRVDSWWSKSHFFGKGRSVNAQKIYSRARDNAFDLDTNEKREEFMHLLG